MLIGLAILAALFLGVVIGCYLTLVAWAWKRPDVELDYGFRGKGKGDDDYAD